MSFLEDHPHLATRSCDRCKKIMYDKGGQEIVREDGTPEPRGVVPDCSMCPKSRVEQISPENFMVYVQYVTCKTLGALPRAGGLDNQDPMLMKKFNRLALLDRHKEIGFRLVSLSMPSLFG